MTQTMQRTGFPVSKQVRRHTDGYLNVSLTGLRADGFAKMEADPCQGELWDAFRIHVPGDTQYTRTMHWSDDRSFAAGAVACGSGLEVECGLVRAENLPHVRSELLRRLAGGSLGVVEGDDVVWYHVTAKRKLVPLHSNETAAVMLLHARAAGAFLNCVRAGEHVLKTIAPVSTIALYDNGTFRTALLGPMVLHGLHGAEHDDEIHIEGFQHRSQVNVYYVPELTVEHLDTYQMLRDTGMDRPRAIAATQMLIDDSTPSSTNRPERISHGDHSC